MKQTGRKHTIYGHLFKQGYETYFLQKNNLFKNILTIAKK